MSLFFKPYRRRWKSRFELEEEDNHRIHFRRLSPYPRPRGRSVWWLAAMIAAVLYLLYYLAKLQQ